MFEVEGKFNSAIVYSDSREEKAIGQIEMLCDQDFTTGANIRIMPDYHFGAGCTIGFTANLGDKVVPNLVGVDISCAMFVVELGKVLPDLKLLDEIIRAHVPCGFNSHKEAFMVHRDISNLTCGKELKNQDRFNRQIGTLGGGNHFIEVDTDDDGNYYLVIHSGSRNLGKQVADYHQDIAINELKGLGNLQELKAELIKKLKKEGKEKTIKSSIDTLEKKFKNSQPKYPKALCFLEGEQRENYLKDMKICQDYASLNRITIANTILAKMYGKALSRYENFHTVHNYIDFKDNIIRKGAVSAYKGERLIIPMNMRDGSLLCTGKGNPDWNFSAPHGAGRLMSRGEAKKTLALNEFENEMKDIYSTSVGQSTLDEAPMAYKSMDEIVGQIADTVTIDKIIKPVYNFKAS